MSQTSGGFLLSLGPFLGQKKVSPAEAECKETEDALESSKEPQCNFSLLATKLNLTKNR